MEASSNPYTVLAEAERIRKPVSVRMYINEVTFQVTLAKNGGFAAIFARSGSPWKLPLGLGWPKNFTKMPGGARKTFK